MASGFAKSTRPKADLNHPKLAILSSTPRLSAMRDEIVQKPADTTADLHTLVRDRWSPRIFDTEHSLGPAELESIGEAFRWAPSSSNQQPWKLVLLTRGSELFESIASTGLTGFNQSWAPDASALAVVLAAKTFEGKDRKMAETYFDVGLASSQLVTQVESMGLKAHFMGGIVPEKIREDLKVSEHEVVCVIALGKQGSILGKDEAIVSRETSPRTRNNSSDVYVIDSTL